MALVAGGIYAYKRWYSAEPASNAERAPKTSVPLRGVQASTDPSEEKNLIARPVIATVYECTGPEGRILSDKPCASDARTLHVRAPNSMVPAKIEIPEEKPKEGGSSGASVGVVIPEIKTCAELDANEALANERLREGPEIYKKKLRQLLSEYAVARKEWKCGRAR